MLSLSSLEGLFLKFYETNHISDKFCFQTLRDEIKYINVFVIAFKQTDTRMTYALRSMISLFEKMFGDGFWDNAILEVLYRTINT